MMADAGTTAEKPKRKPRKPKERVAITEGWYIPQERADEEITPPRWVLAVGNGYVYYSRGDTTHFECSIETMRRWIARYKAKRPEAKR
jgi:hypothetical protein